MQVNQDISHLKLKIKGAKTVYYGAKKEFGDKKSICIKRDWFERWLSSLQYILVNMYDIHGSELIRKWEDVDNQFIYDIFTDDVLNTFHLRDQNPDEVFYSKFFYVIS